MAVTGVDDPRVSESACSRPAPARGAHPPCYVCGRPIRSGGVKIPGGLERHSRCAPGSKRHDANRRLARKFQRDLRRKP